MPKGHIYNTKSIDGVRVLKIVGAFTKDTIPDLQKICYAIGKEHTTKGVLLDFREVSTIDTSAFACVISFIKDHMTYGVNIGVINLKSQEKMLAELLKISEAIQPFKSESEAIAGLSKKKRRQE